MEIKVLVAYASSHGSTQEIAEVIAAVLREHGLATDILPMRRVRTLSGYQAVVLGAPIYLFHLHKDALRFLRWHKKALAGDLPVAIFAGGPFATGDEKEWHEVRYQLDQELAQFLWLKPVAVELVGGKFDPARLHFPWSLMPALRQMPASDLRDWTAIRAWAGNLSEQLQPVVSS